MMDYKKYRRQYFMPPIVTHDWVKKDHIEKAPFWCSVDLRDGNQALVEPMGLEEKLAYFDLLVSIGFKEIEVGFPAASDTEYRFIRTLIEENRVPEDVTLQVLTQAREHIVKKTFEAVRGAKRAIVHLYNSVSAAQREQVFGKSKEEIRKLAVDGAALLKQLADGTDGDFSFEYSPESFSGAEVDYAAEVCNAVLEVWRPTVEHKAIINIPTTVENAMPHVFAAQLEYIGKHLEGRDAVTLSIHPHNDRGCGVATAEMGVLAGADRVEGTLFGNGERTGNVDIVTLAMNLLSQGVDPRLDFSDMPSVSASYEKWTRMQVPPRHPYAGDLVFTAFSGSHQDAIAKGMKWREEKGGEHWTVPYLPIDPKDVGRTYDADVIRINSQSGKGGVSFILKQNFGLELPARMKEEVGYMVKGVSDQEHKELTPEWIYRLVKDRYIDNTPVFTIPECRFRQEQGMAAHVTIACGENRSVVISGGNGRLDAVSNAVKQYFKLSYDLSIYEEHAVTAGSSSEAAAYVGLCADGKLYWGIGIDEDIIRASIDALVAAVNRLQQTTGKKQRIDGRLNKILNYIGGHYQTVTLEELAETFHLSQPYLSKYIKEKSGKTFGDIVADIRLRKACALLKGERMTVEAVAEQTGYMSVEHFNRQFKRKYGVTPGQYRSERRV